MGHGHGMAHTNVPTAVLFTRRRHDTLNRSASTDRPDRPRMPCFALLCFDGETKDSAKRHAALPDAISFRHVRAARTSIVFLRTNTFSFCHKPMLDSNKSGMPQQRRLRETYNTCPQLSLNMHIQHPSHPPHFTHVFASQAQHTTYSHQSHRHTQTTKKQMPHM